MKGVALDGETAAPVEGASVTLIEVPDGEAEGEEAVARAVTDGTGAFLLTAPRAGRYRLHLARIGYAATATQPIDLREDEELEVEVHLFVEAVPVAPLTVLSDRPALLRSPRLEFLGFYDRSHWYGPERLGAGYFLEREDIERMTPFHITDALTMVPRAWVGSDQSGRRRTIELRRGCPPDIYLDGHVIRMANPHGRDFHIDDLGISPSLVEGIEVYYGRTRPLQFQSLPSGRRTCGAVVIWTGPRRVER